MTRWKPSRLTHGAPTVHYTGIPVDPSSIHTHTSSTQSVWEKLFILFIFDKSPAHRTCVYRWQHRQNTHIYICIERSPSLSFNNVGCLIRSLPVGRALLIYTAAAVAAAVASTRLCTIVYKVSGGGSGGGGTFFLYTLFCFFFQIYIYPHTIYLYIYCVEKKFVRLAIDWL